MNQIMKFRYFSGILVLMIFISACNTSVIRPPKPKNLISEDVMAEILADVHIAEASIQLANSEDDSIHQTYVNYYNTIFEKYNVSREAFIQSMDYYIKNPIRLQKIYDDVTEILSTKRGVKM